MLSHAITPAFFKIDNPLLGSTTLVVKGELKNSFNHNSNESRYLDTKLKILDKEFSINSILIRKNQLLKVQIQLLEDELLEDDMLNIDNSSEILIDEQYLGRTDEQITAIEQAMVEAELSGVGNSCLSGNCDGMNVDLFLNLDEIFSQPILLDSCWQNIYTILFKHTNDPVKSANQTKDIYIQVEKKLNDWSISYQDVSVKTVS
mgnify:CR=1 FL=1